jgi:hypothetical protein
LRVTGSSGWNYRDVIKGIGALGALVSADFYFGHEDFS